MRFSLPVHDRMRGYAESRNGKNFKNLKIAVPAPPSDWIPTCESAVPAMTVTLADIAANYASHSPGFSAMTGALLQASSGRAPFLSGSLHPASPGYAPTGFAPTYESAVPASTATLAAISPNYASYSPSFSAMTGALLQASPSFVPTYSAVQDPAVTPTPRSPSFSAISDTFHFRNNLDGSFSPSPAENVNTPPFFSNSSISTPHWDPPTPFSSLSAPHTPGSPSMKKATCFFWYHGLCKRGRRCSYPHSYDIMWPIASPPPNYVHYSPCDMPWCPIRDELVQLREKYAAEQKANREIESIEISSTSSLDDDNDFNSDGSSYSGDADVRNREAHEVSSRTSASAGPRNTINGIEVIEISSDEEDDNEDEDDDAMPSPANQAVRTNNTERKILPMTRSSCFKNHKRAHRKPAVDTPSSVKELASMSNNEPKILSISHPGTLRNKKRVFEQIAAESPPASSNYTGGNNRNNKNNKNRGYRSSSWYLSGFPSSNAGSPAAWHGHQVAGTTKKIRFLVDYMMPEGEDRADWDGDYLRHAVGEIEYV